MKKSLLFIALTCITCCSVIYGDTTATAESPVRAATPASANPTLEGIGPAFANKMSPRNLVSFWETESPVTATKLQQAFSWILPLRNKGWDKNQVNPTPQQLVTREERQKMVGMTADEIIAYVAKLKEQKDDEFQIAQ